MSIAKISYWKKTTIAVQTQIILILFLFSFHIPCLCFFNTSFNIGAGHYRRRQNTGTQTVCP